MLRCQREAQCSVGDPGGLTRLLRRPDGQARLVGNSPVCFVSRAGVKICQSFLQFFFVVCGTSCDMFPFTLSFFLIHFLTQPRTNSLSQHGPGLTYD